MPLVGKTRILMKCGDITLESVDAIVNAANERLSPGGGVDGAIHRAGGPSILDALKRIKDDEGGCPTGESVITTGGDLEAKYVIHAVGPKWKKGTAEEEDLLQNAYISALQLAVENEIKTIAFPSISTGAFGYPIDRAALVALSTAKMFATEIQDLSEIRFVLFTEEDLNVYLQTAQAIF